MKTTLTLTCLAAVLTVIPVQAQRPASYSFTKVATLGESAPGGGFHINDFEPGALNNRGDVIYGTDLGTAKNANSFFGEGVFLRPKGRQLELELARATGKAPGGGVFDFLLMGQTSLNDEGDGALAFALSPFDVNASPLGLNAGVYRYSHVTGAVAPVVIPSVTPAPGGGKFAGAGFNTSLNNRGDLAFAGIVPAGLGPKVGFFKADKAGVISSVLSPGDPAPGGGTFDSAANGGPWINDGGDVAFAAHIAGEDPAFSSLYVRKAATGKLVSIVHALEAAPGGGVFRSAYSSVINSSGEVAFQGDLSSAGKFFEALGVFLYSHGAIQAVARPGDPMPGGGKFVTASFVTAENVHVNNPGEVAFNALLDTGDTGLYVWSHGSVQLVARTGTVMSGIGVVAQLIMGVITFPPAPGTLPNSGAINNDSGQVLFGATLSDGRGVLLIATPHD